MREHERFHPGARRSLTCIFDRRVIVENVVESRGLRGQHLLHRADEVGSQDGLHVDVGVGAQSVELGAGHGVSGERGNFSFCFESKADGGRDGAVVGATNAHGHVADGKGVAG